MASASTPSAKNHLLVNGDVGMANRFSKKYGNKG